MTDAAPNLGQTLEDLLQRGPARPARLTRIARDLQARWPGRYVFRFADHVDHLIAWLDAAEVPQSGREFFPAIGFDTDLDSARASWEGGWCAFEWEGRSYELLSLHLQFTYAWVAAESREAADALVGAVARHSRTFQHNVMVFDGGYWQEAPRLEAGLAGYSWASIVLPGAMKTRLQRAAETFFHSEEVYRRLGIPWKLGFLLVGPPGTGKTLTTKILARTCGVPFLYVRGLEGSSPDGETLRDMMQGARDRAPCLLCLEDVDSLVTEGLRSVFLNELDGLEEDFRGVLTVATTNHPERLDAALLHRPSRFDYRFEFPLPNDEQRRAFVRHWVEKLAPLGYVTDPAGAVDEIVRRSQGMSHAYLKRVLVSTVMRMHTLEERGDEAFHRLALEELADAITDRTIARRAESVGVDGAGIRVGFHPD